MTIKESIDDYILHCKLEKNLSDKSIEAYTIDLQQFYSFSLTQNLELISSVDRIILREYFHQLSRFKPRTIKRKIACLTAMFTYLEFGDVIVVNPFRKMQFKYNTPKYLPSVMTKSEVNKFILVVYKERTLVSDKSSNSYRTLTRDICVLEGLFSTGVRVSELCNLQFKDINLSTGTILISGKGNKERIVQIVDARIKELFTEYLALFRPSIEKTNYFFVNRLGNPLSSQSVRYMIKKYTELAGIKKHITPHTFRHTFATLLLEADVDLKYIQHFLGHSSIMTTQIYTHVNKEKQLQILKLKHPRLDMVME